MVKFGKQLERELVPEWREAYCTYKDLKRDVKRIKHQRSTGPTFTRTGSIGLLRSIVSFKHNSRNLGGPPRPDKISFSPRGQPRDVIVVGGVRCLETSSKSNHCRTSSVLKRVLRISSLFQSHAFVVLVSVSYMFTGRVSVVINSLRRIKARER